MILLFSIISTLIAIKCQIVGAHNKTIGKYQIYYDSEGKPVPQIDAENSSSTQELLVKNGVMRFGFLPCTCEDEFDCGCCVNLKFIRFERSMCSNFTFDPLEFAIRMNMDFDGATIFNRTMSAKNPPPACFDQPYIPGVRFCLKLFDIYTPGRNLHMCINLEARFITAPILVLEFDCIQMGSEGFMHGKPSEFPQRNSTLNETELEKLVNYENSIIELYNSTDELSNRIESGFPLRNTTLCEEEQDNLTDCENSTYGNNTIEQTDDSKH